MTTRFNESIFSFFASVAIIAIVVLRGADLWSNGTYMQTHRNYWGIYYVDVLMVFGGVSLLALYAAGNSHRNYAGFFFAIFGFGAVVVDPDFPHFLRDPLIFLSTDLVFTTVLLVGIPFTVLLLVSAFQAQRRRSAIASS